MLSTVLLVRMDDLQDNWIRPAQITGMNLFLSKSIPLSLAIIMNSISNDSQIIDKIKAGINRPNALFELGLHGWNHVNYANLSERERQILFTHDYLIDIEIRTSSIIYS